MELFRERTLAYLHRRYDKHTVDLWFVTTLYYCRTTIYVCGILAILAIFEYFSRDYPEIHATHAIIAYAALLMVLIYIKKYEPILYEQCKWFATPGNIFLKSWTPLMFFVYMVQAPLYLQGIAPQYIISWLIQDVLGNMTSIWFTALLITWVFNWASRNNICGTKNYTDNGEEKAQEDKETEKGLGRTLDGDIFNHSTPKGSSFGDDSIPPNTVSLKSGDTEKLLNIQRSTMIEELSSSWRSSVAFEKARKAQLERSKITLTYLGDLADRPADKDQFQEEASGQEEAENNYDIARSSVSLYALSNNARLSIRQAATMNEEQTAIHMDANGVPVDMMRSSLSHRSVASAPHLRRSTLSRSSTNTSFLTAGGTLAVHENSLRSTLQNLTDAAGGSKSLSVDDQEYQIGTNNPLRKSLETLEEASVESFSSIEMADLAAKEKKEGAMGGTKTNSSNYNQKLTVADDLVLPYVPTMAQLFYFWNCCVGFTSLLIVLCHREYFSLVVLFQLSATISLYIACTHYRQDILKFLRVDKISYVSNLLEAPVLMLPVLIFVVIFSSPWGYEDSTKGLLAYLVPAGFDSMNTWGAGNYLACLLNSVIVTMAWSTCESIMTFSNLIPLLIPTLFLICFVVLLFDATLAMATCTPLVLGKALLTRSVTTPVAIELSELTESSAHLIATNNVINGIIALKTAIFQLNFWGFDKPIARGVAGGVGGTLLGVIAMEQAAEPVATGLGMAGYGLASFIMTVIIIIPNLRDLFVTILEYDAHCSAS